MVDTNTSLNSLQLDRTGAVAAYPTKEDFEERVMGLLDGVWNMCKFEVEGSQSEMMEKLWQSFYTSKNSLQSANEQSPKPPSNPLSKNTNKNKQSEIF